MTAAGALSLEALGANPSLFHQSIGAVRPYAGLKTAIAQIRDLLSASWLTTQTNPRSLQDPLTFRNMPHILGAGRDALAFLDQQLAIELNASQSNPIVVEGEEKPISCANYEIFPLVTAVDHLRITLATLFSASAERSIKLLETPWSGLPTGLITGGDSSEPGLSYFGIVVQALATEARLLAAPISYDIVSTSHAEGIEDRATNSPLAARRLAEQVALGRRIVAIELAVSAQAVDLRARLPLGKGTTQVHQIVRQHVPHVKPGDEIPSLESLVERLASHLFPKCSWACCNI